MSRKAAARRIYEARVVEDALARLAQRLDLRTLPFTDEELQNLARRTRESLRSERNKKRLDGYKTHLSARHGGDSVRMIAAALEEINNAIRYEEK